MQAEEKAPAQGAHPPALDPSRALPGCAGRGLPETRSVVTMTPDSSMGCMIMMMIMRFIYEFHAFIQR